MENTENWRGWRGWRDWRFWREQEQRGTKKAGWNSEQWFVTKIVDLFSDLFESIWNSWLWVLFIIALIIGWMWAWFDFNVLQWTEPLEKILFSVMLFSMLWAFVTPLYSKVSNMNGYFLSMWKIRDIEWKEIVKLSFQWVFTLVLSWLAYISFQCWEIASNVFSNLVWNNSSLFEMITAWFWGLISLIMFLVVSWAVYGFLLNDMSLDKVEDVWDKVVKSWIIAFIALFILVSVTGVMKNKFWEISDKTWDSSTISDIDEMFK